MNRPDTNPSPAQPARATPTTTAAPNRLIQDSPSGAPRRRSGVPVPVAELVRTGRVAELRGIGRAIEARLRELVETGGIAELERELAPT